MYVLIFPFLGENCPYVVPSNRLISLKERIWDIHTCTYTRIKDLSFDVILLQ